MSLAVRIYKTDLAVIQKEGIVSNGIIAIAQRPSREPNGDYDRCEALPPISLIISSSFVLFVIFVSSASY